MLAKNVSKHLNKLQQKKYRREYKEFVVEGVKGVDEALASANEVLTLVVEGKRRDEPEFKTLITAAEAKGTAIMYCGRNDIDLIKSTETFPGILAVLAMPEIVLEDFLPGHIICLDRVQDPGNLGTIIRTADWFGVKNILLSEESVDVYNPKTVRGTMGSIFHLQVFVSKNLVSSLKSLVEKKDYRVVSLELGGQDISSLKVKEPTIFVFGSESHGLRPALAELVEERYTIPGNGGAESLNLAIAAGILMSKL